MPTAGSLDLPSFRATVDHRAGAGGSARQRGDQRHHARASRETGPARRAVGFGADSAPSGIDRPRPQVPQRPAACSCERRWRRGGTRAGGSRRSRGARAGGRRARARAGRLRAAGGVGRGRCARPLAVGRREGGSRWCAAWPSLAVCAPPRPQGRGWSNQAAWGRCLGFGDAIGVRGAASTSHPYDGARPGAKLPGNPRSRRHCECALTTTPRAVFGHGHEGCACGGEAATCSGAARPGGQRARARGTPCVLCA